MTDRELLEVIYRRQWWLFGMHAAVLSLLLFKIAWNLMVGKVLRETVADTARVQAAELALVSRLNEKLDERKGGNE